ncbi:sialidase [Sinimarinibacterium sp. CAU 1509]|uniref:WD40/YVTN/BNR-like repeat-containing protein n=1 Tax=Sinimarinibacterium sp. CAU 1509 TaxID=2562283 RepID=UPI0010AD75DD|nr:sialidase [Sinimarinibacterium sp. CAU 1509]TJY58875.1 sialidase [Sinimarinibacterium sp. CAU 1509]
MNDTGSTFVHKQREASTAPAAKAAGSVWSNGWPSLLMAAVVIGAVVYSFSPRPAPNFAPTQIYPDRILVNALAQQGSRILAVGEQGDILLANSADGPWRSATKKTVRGSTLTQAAFVGDGIAIAVGHDGWILRSTDAGETWTEVSFNDEGGDPLLGLAGPYNGTVYAFGAFGLMMSSTDLGQTWQRTTLNINLPQKEAVEAVPTDDDPFATGGMADDHGDRHLNAMTQAKDGTLVLVGERGLILRSTDAGQSWTPVDDVYAGSFFGIEALPSGTLVVYGMRGHVFRSEDQGLSWTQSTDPLATSLFGGAVIPDGTLVLVGASNTVLVSKDDGRTFTQSAADNRNGLTDLLPLPEGGWLTAGEGGLKIQRAIGGERS